ncbi:hypothetical protein EXIGLDRAFT_762025 [Exidia glandulosa HHB12029]|uniref:F-box domain-containing protein n=1 Tax=Exidia glandulosa HHB12029 TaxID=1314781 RepID=A0A165N3P2_EXIGL|nr:hypothetical protein EXIGLDRAFT_762025 [Exidia glandulosa HHB12029]
MSPSQAVHVVDDVLYGVYDHIWIWDLIKLRLVSKRWDVTIREHPHYWKELAVKIRTPGAVEFLLARLAASRHRPIDVRVLVKDDDEKVDVAQLPEHYRVT